MPDNDQNIGIVTTFFVLALALLLYYARSHSGGDMLSGLLMDLCMVFTPPLVSVLRAWEVMNSPDPFAASTTAAKALNADEEELSRVEGVVQEQAAQDRTERFRGETALVLLESDGKWAASRMPFASGSPPQNDELMNLQSMIV